MWDKEDNNESIIKPCPFCGCKDIQVMVEELECTIECSNCEISAYSSVYTAENKDFERICKLKWNKRV